MALGIYLEVWFSSRNGHFSSLLFSDEIGNSPDVVARVKSRYSNKLLTCILRDPRFIAACLSETGTTDLGTHSLRKYPATFARSSGGCTADEIEIRGRWKRDNSRTVSHYIMVEQAYIDAKVAASLCVGGPVKYKMVEGGGLSSDWLLTHVVPGIAAFYTKGGNTIASVLALPVLWACYDHYYSTKLPEWLIVRIKGEYEKIRTLPENTNPVQKIHLTIFHTNGNLCVDEMVTEFDGVTLDNGNTNNNNNNATRSDARGGNMLNAILIQQQQLQGQMNMLSEQLNSSLGGVRGDIERKIDVVNKNI